MLKSGEAQRLDLTALRNITCCGAKLNFVELVHEIRAHYPHLAVCQSYGCTENGYIANLPPRDAAAGHLDSVGYLFPGIRAKIVDPSRPQRRLGPGERGELLIWSRSLFQGYKCCPGIDAEQVFANCHAGSYYRTGDQAHFDEAGRLYIHGRFKDTLVLMGDWKIMPAELEEVVDAHWLVESSAVVGLPDPALPACHKPRAFVKLVAKSAGLARLQSEAPNELELIRALQADDLEAVAAHIEGFVADRVAPAKRLSGGVRILDEFPRVGLLKKVDRKVLREL